ncbi:MAG: PKD domain-containing protein [Crocinitomicaceae bacterium]|nr:PKD domain-containing protein [Crocinitomicaceae bacterium]
MKRISSIIFIVFISLTAFGQTYNMTNGSVTTCSGTFYDSGGSGGDYGISETFVFTICSSVAGQSPQLNFTSFSIESGWDDLYIYDGATTGSPLIGSYTGTGSPGVVTASGSCITIQFTSDGSVVYPGWAATISCVTPPPPGSNVNMSNGSTSLCSGNFYDSGGPSSNYGFSQNLTYTICPSTPGSMVQVNFTSFDLENNYDFLTIYDGNSTAAPTLGSYTGSAGPGIAQATPGNPTGCLTFVFTSDGSFSYTGWAATISCTQPCQTITANIASVTPAPVAGYVKICQGQSVNFTGSGTFSSSGAGATYSWNFGDGTSGTGTSVSHAFPTSGSYAVGLTITDPSGCSNSNSATQVVQVSTTPTIVTNAAPNPICLGQSSNLTANVTMTPYVPNCTPPVSGTTFLPDGSGVSYTTSITVNCFNSGQTITSAADFSNICLNIEHSFLGDLDIVIICPNGQSMTLKDYPGGGGTYLGGALDDGSTTPGTGSTYCFTPGATTLLVDGSTVTAGSPAGASITPGNYMPVDPWSNLFGCPLNGAWTIQVTDNLSIDNGYIFNWDVNFTVPPAAGGFTPTIASQGWVATPGLTSTGATTASVTPTAAGTPCYTYSVTDNFGCTYTQTQCVTVNNAPSMTSANTASICSGGTVSIPLTSTMAGTTYTWVATANPNVTGESTGTQSTSTLSNTLTNSTGAVQTVTYTVTPTAGGCAGTPQTVTVTVNPIPTVTDPANQTLCANTATTAVNFTGTAGATFNWTNNNTSIGLAASGSGNIASFTATNAGATPITATITVTPTLGGCTGTAQTFTITVNPIPTVTDPANQTLCANTATTAVTFTGTAGATFNWTNNTPSIGLAASGSGNIASFTAINAGTTPVTATITVTPTLAGCTGTAQTFTITVNPIPTVTDPANQTLCANTATTAVNFTGAIAGTTYNWTNSNTTIGLAASGSGNIASFTAINAGTTPVTATITVTPTLAGCTGTAQTFTITVNPIPTVTDPANQTLCANTATTAVNFTGAIAGTTYNWTNSNTTIGLAASGSGNIASFTATNAGTTPVTATITVTPTLAGCTGTAQTFTITVNPIPTVTDPANQTLCANTATTAVNFTGAIAGTTYNWTNSNTTIGLAASGSGNIASFTAINAGTTPVTATITVTPTLGGCTGTAQTFTITVNPIPTVTDPANQTLCANTATTAVNFTGAIAGTTYNWTNSNTTIGLAASGSGNIASFTAINAGTTPVTATITVTPTLAGCTGTAQTFTITVNPTPTVTDPADQSICAGGSTTAVNFTGSIAGTTYNWTNNNTSIGLAASGTGNIASFIGVNGTGAPITATITVTPTTGGCTGTPQTFTITVTPNPVIAVAGTNPTICTGTDGTITITGLAASTAYSVSYTDDGVPVGPLAMTSNAGGSIVITGLNAGAYTNFQVSMGSCVSTSATLITLVDPNPPMVNDPADQTLCSGNATTAVNFTGTAGATFNWTNSNTSIGLAASGSGNIASFTATNATALPITATITVTPTLAGCTGTAQTFTITVNPTPTVTDPADQTLCSGNATTAVNFTGTAGATFNWTNSNTAIGLAASGSGNIPSFTATNATALPISATITVTPVLGPCTGTPQAFTITVNPTPTVTDPSDQTLCSGNATTAVNFTGTAGATFNWTNSNTAIGLAASGSGNIPSFTATNATALPISATITVTPVLGPCTGTPQTFTISVNPTPTVTDPADQSVCAGGTTTAVNFTGTAGATFNWTNNNTGIGLAASGTGNIASFTGINGTGAPVTATITVTPVLGPCTGTPQTFTITVNPNPVIAVAGTNPTICTGTDGTITITGLAASTAYSVSYTDDGVPVGPLAMTSNAGGSIVITGLNAGAYTNFQVSMGSCVSTSATLITLVDPNPPMVNDPADQTLCANMATTAVTFTGTAGATFNWTNNTPSIGLAASGSGNIASFTAINAGTTPVTATITVTPTLAGCTGTAQTFTITVNPIPTLTDPADQTLCANTATTAVTFVGTAGATFNWTNNNTSIGLAASGSGDIASFTGLNPTPGTTATATITVTPVLSGCSGTPQTFTISVINTLPTLTCPGNLTAVCSITEQPAYANYAAFVAAGGSSSSVGGTINTASFTLVSEVSDGNTCPETVTRTYSIQDDCGSTATCTQTIVINDNINPTATAPANITVECIGDVPAADPTLITDEADNCSVPTVAFVSDASDGNTCPETITRTYSITDACGNTITVTQTIVVDDTTNPTASNPSSITVPGGPAPAPDPTVVVDEADNCTLNPTVAFVSDVTDGNLCPETITRTYSVTDNCGNQITVTQLILITDPIMPTASNPAPVTVECIADVPAPDPTVVIDEADNNGVPTVAFVSDVSDGLTCPETITRTYSVTDNCANVITVTQTITVNDITNPTGTAPANITVQCIADVPAADVTLINDEADNCTANPDVQFVSDVSDGNTCPETITRTYSITDDCSNTINVTQTIVVDDTTNPTATAPANITVECIGDVPAADPTLITDEADNCSVPTVAFVSDASDGNTCPETITRTYSITDACGNTITVTQTIVVDDTTNPTASNPASITVPGGPAPAPDPTVVVDEADNCTLNPTVAFVSDVTDGNLCPETITRTYSVTDNCGNQITVTQTILITDPIMPTASNPAPVTVECIADVPAADPTVVIDEADNNGVPTVAFVSDVSDGNTCPETITRTYSVTDNCANQIMVTQQIIVNDITNPTGTAPANITVQCIADVPAADVTLITDEADNCTANPDVQFMSDVSDGNTCPETITRTYSITDDCGNSINVTQTIVVDDTTNPTASNPASVTVECIADVPAADPLVVIDEADNCSVPTVAFVSDASDGNTCPETITRTYSITDACGNTITVTQTIVVDDTTNPTASNPSSITVPGGPAPAPDPTVVVDEADNCTLNPTVAFVSDVTDGNLCPETITRTYSVTDNCGNQITVTQLILITDPIMPTASNPAPVTVECIADVPAPDPTVVIDEADNNGVPTVAFVSDVSDGLTCPETITRTYSVTDNCANVITVTQTITVNDITNPTGTAPANITVQCIADVPAADVTLINDEADNCTANPDVQFVSDVSDGNTCPETITRTYSITDDCSNTINVTQTIVVDDTTNPTATAPANITVECIGDVPAADPTLITDEADNCSVPTVAFVSDASDGNTRPETITRTYSITDACGNTITVTQTIVVDDTTNPTASNPSSITVPGGPAPAPDPTVVVDEADNCTLNPTVAFVSDVTDGNLCPETITRTYSVTDNCGNQITVTQLILITDPIMPTASNPAPVTVECIADVPAPDPTVVIDEADNNEYRPLHL